MAAAMVTMAELRSNLGIGTLYSDATVEECCQSAEDLISGYLWHNDAPVVGSSISNNVATLVLANPGIFVTGQQLVISNCGSTYNGTYTLTGSFPGTTVPASIGTAFWSTYAFSSYPNGYSIIQYAKVSADDPFHFIKPYGRAHGPEHKAQAYTATPAIREAAMIVAVDIWQARQVSQTGGVGMDGITASPYRMGYQLINRVRGLIQPYSSPNSLVG
jgi:hypothetical protein